MCNLDYPLPWYNTLFWTAVVVPVGLLALGVVGLVHAGRHGRSEPAGMLVVFQWAVLLIVRALPGVPPHDGIRLFLPSFAMLAALVGLGCQSRMCGRYGAVDGRTEWGNRSFVFIVISALSGGAGLRRQRHEPAVVRAAVALVLQFADRRIARHTALGMEPTYYWDALDRSVLDWLQRHTPPGDKIRFGSAPPENLALLRCWGMLPGDDRQQGPGRFAWYVIQRRPSAWEPCDEWLIEHCRPAFQKTIRPGGWGPWRLDVPLIDVYPYAEYVQAVGRVERSEPHGSGAE